MGRPNPRHGRGRGRLKSKAKTKPPKIQNHSDTELIVTPWYNEEKN